MKARFGVAVCVTAAALLACDAPGAPPAAEPALRTMVEADWFAQERRARRSPSAPAAIRHALGRAERLLADFRARRWGGSSAAAARRLGELQRSAAGIDSLDGPARLALYRNVRWFTRDLALSSPLLGGRPIVFMKRRRFICQMLHEYLGYFYDYADIAGGGVHVLDKPGVSLTTRDLIRGRLGRGNYATLSLSYDARTVYFAFTERAPTKPDFYSPQRRCFHLYAVGADGRGLRQLTRGGDDDFDPCPLPDGGLAFMSTRRGGFARCNNPWEPLPSYTLHRMDATGADIRTLSFHETSEWHPSVLGDGRIVYTRWDYVDRSAANFHGLWASNPDGTRPVILFGNYTKRINACFQPRAIPGSRRIAFIAGAHHADVGGSLVIVDPARTALDAKTGQDRFESIEVLTPEVCFPEAPGWPESYFHSPWPLSEDHFLVSFGYDKLPGMSSGNRTRESTGLYYFDRFGNLELLYRQDGVSCMYPVPLSPRAAPPTVPSARQADLGAEGEFILVDVRQSHFALPADRPVKALRIFQVLPKTHSHVANQPRIGHANAESARMMLGTVPVESDGSAWFRAPAGKPLYFQAVDANCRAVQSMRSVTYLQPGERRGCLGCHEPPAAAPAVKRLKALSREPSAIRPGPDGTRPFSFPRLVQPVLDRHCLRCHDGKRGPKGKRPILTGEPAGTFTRSYNSLGPYVRWYEWGGRSISAVVTRPGRIGADASRLTKILTGPEHTKRLKLTDAERRRITIWLDGNAPFYGTYDKAQRQAQRAGKSVAAPEIQ